MIPDGHLSHQIIMTRRPLPVDSSIQIITPLKIEIQTCFKIMKIMNTIYMIMAIIN